MPAEIARVNFGDILQAIEDKLVADLVVADRSQVVWAIDDDEPQFSGVRDILLRARGARKTGHDGGAWDFRMVRLVDVYARAQAIDDPGGGAKEFVKAQFVLHDLVLSSLCADPDGHPEDFWPTDANGNLLTTQAIVLAKDLGPERRQTKDSAWGDTVCTLEVHYLPKLILKK